MKKTQLATYNNDWYNPGGGLLKRGLWYVFSNIFINSALPFSFIKVFLLKMFGADIKSGVVIKPHVNIKYPWNLKLGNNVWIGEKVWIDNLAMVTLADNVCLSQGAFLLCGNHNYSSTTFDLSVAEIHLEDGVWIAARAIVGPGVRCHSHSVLSVNSVATSNLNPFGIYRGNPAVQIKERTIL